MFPCRNNIIEQIKSDVNIYKKVWGKALNYVKNLR